MGSHMNAPVRRLLKYPWHTAHDYELAKIGHQFLYLTDTHRVWDRAQRPVPDTIRWVPSMDAEPTDAMILHVDQWTLQEPAKRALVETRAAAYPGPKLVINHGCNLVDGCSSSQMAEFLSWADAVVCNSSTAWRLWNLPASRYIHHGMDVDEWPLTTGANHGVTVVQAYGTMHRACRNHEGVQQAERKVPVTWIGRDRTFGSFDAYREFLRHRTIFYSPSHASPNPRARTEAMLCGLAVVTTNTHDEDQYIQHGVNGFCSNDIDELVDILVYLQANPGIAREIGLRGRETARERFTTERFAAQWNQLLDEVLP